MMIEHVVRVHFQNKRSSNFEVLARQQDGKSGGKAELTPAGNGSCRIFPPLSLMFDKMRPMNLSASSANRRFLLVFLIRDEKRMFSKAWYKTRLHYSEMDQKNCDRPV
jgi:hypothetical protein